VSDSYPPHLLRLPGSAPGSPARGRQEQAQVAVPAPAPVAVAPGGQQDASQLLLATPGTPGAYAPAVSPRERPRNVTQLDRRVQPATPEPWPRGAYIQVGESGKRAHWTGTSWKGGESPGYSAGQTVVIGSVRSEPEQSGEVER
jgi:hypothetical protein